MPRLTLEVWEYVRAEYQAGASQASLASKCGVTRRAIQKRIEAEGWSRRSAMTVARLAESTVAPLVAGGATFRASGLTPRQERFARAWALDRNKTKAYRMAFPRASAATARTEAGRLVRDPRIQKYVQGIVEGAFANAEVSAQDVTKGLARIAFADLRRMYGQDGRILPPEQWPDDLAFALQGVSEKHSRTGEVVRTVKIPDRNQALRTLAEMGGHLKDDKATVGTASFTFNFGPPPANGAAKGAANASANERQMPGRVIEHEPPAMRVGGGEPEGDER